MVANKWDIDAGHSSIVFSVRHMVVSKTRGRFTKFGGTVELDDGDLAGSRTQVTIDAASIDTDLADRDAHLRSADFLDVEKHPTITFRSKRIEKVSGERSRILGDLEIRGVSREVALDVEYAGREKDPWGGERVGFSAHGVLSRKAFGLEWNQVLETGGLLVGDEVKFEIELEAIRAKAEKAA
jgi:polyisoprenoid-binding protein YceI